MERTNSDGRLRAVTGAAAGGIAVAGMLLGSPAAALDRTVVTHNAMVAAGHPLAVQAGIKALQNGGTACDAAVATAAVLSITMTDMMGPAGSGYALLWNQEAGELKAIDYNGVAPLATDPALFTMEGKRRGILAPTVPGALKGWEAIHQDCGQLEWASLWEDAIAYAEDGWPIDTDTAFHIRRHIPELGIYPTWVDAFLIDGRAPERGEILRRPNLAATYRQFAEQGAAALYGGDVGERFAAFMEAEGGLITMADLEAYEVRWSDPIHVTYRGYDVYGNPPSSSSITWMQMLAIMDGYDVAALGHNTAEYLHLFIEASKRAHMDAYAYNTDPAFSDVPVDRLLSPDYADELRQKIEADGVWKIEPYDLSYVDLPQRNTATSHMTIVDRWGNAVSSTNTNGTFYGAGIVVGDTGLMLSNGMDWFDIDLNIWTGERPGPLVMEPGKRNRWTLSPGMLFRDGELAMVVGGAGAESTMWGIAQPIVNVIDFGMDTQNALNAPRFRYGDIYHYTGGTQTDIPAGIGADVYDALRAMGHELSPHGEFRNPARGTTNMIVLHPTARTLMGGAAPQGRDFVSGY